MYVDKRYTELKEVLMNHNLVKSDFDDDMIFVKIRCVDDIDMCTFSLRSNSFTLFPNEFEPKFVSQTKNPKTYRFLNPFIKRYIQERYDLPEPFHISHIPNVRVFSYLDQLFRRNFGRLKDCNGTRLECKKIKQLQTAYNIYVKIIRDNFNVIPDRDRYLKLYLPERRLKWY